MEKYISPEIEIINFEAVDVLSTGQSKEGLSGEVEWD